MSFTVESEIQSPESSSSNPIVNGCRKKVSFAKGVKSESSKVEPKCTCSELYRAEQRQGKDYAYPGITVANRDAHRGVVTRGSHVVKEIPDFYPVQEQMEIDCDQVG